MFPPLLQLQIHKDWVVMKVDDSNTSRMNVVIYATYSEKQIFQI